MKKGSRRVVSSKKSTSNFKRNLLLAALVPGLIGVGYLLYQTFAATSMTVYLADDMKSANECGPQPSTEVEDSSRAGDLAGKTILRIPNNLTKSCPPPAVMIRGDAIADESAAAQGKIVQMCVIIRASSGDSNVGITLRGTTEDERKTAVVSQDSYQKICSRLGTQTVKYTNVTIENLGKKPLHLYATRYYVTSTDSTTEPTDPTPTEPTTPTSPSASALYGEVCKGTVKQSVGGNVEYRDSAPLREISGVVASRTQSGVLWVHNDSGDSPRVFAINQSGKILGQFSLTGTGITNGDMEDISIGPGPVDGKQYLYLGVIGDNAKSRPNIKVYRFQEPTANLNGGSKTVTAEKITLVYPNGPENSEAFFVDPRNGEWVIIQKTTNSKSHVHTLAGKNLAAGSTHTLKLQPTVVSYLSGNPDKMYQAITGSDMSEDGSTILVRTYNAVYAYEVGSKSASQALATTYCKGPKYSENQGEGVAVLNDKLGYVSISEGKSAPVNLFLKP